ncbi:MAG: sarcosine oxidase subunit alpha family protein [Kiloniellaceae bacterium]
MRLPQGGLVERDRTLTFTFNGKSYKGLGGDSLASALLANGIHLVGRSFKYHRPRGIVSAGAEEPNALMQVGDEPRTEPNLKAPQVELVDGLKATSQNAWPSLEFDVGAVNSLVSRFLPSGFYYKTFMWPAAAWKTYEHFIRAAAGLGRSPRERDPDRYDKTFAHCDLLVVGAGPTGLAAALAAGRAGARVILAEQDHRLGGALLNSPPLNGSGEIIDGKPALDWIAAAEAELAAMPEVRILKRTIAYAAFDHNFFGLVEGVTDHLPHPPESLPRRRLWKLRTKQVLYCAGAIARPLVFADNDRPGVMTASSVQAYVNRYALRPGRRAVVFTNNDSGYGAALDMAAAGIEVAAVVDARPAPTGPLTERAEAQGLRIIAESAIVAVAGKKRVKSVRVAELASDGKTMVGVAETIECDLVANSGGWNPTVHLFCQAKGKLRWDDAHACFVPDTAMQAGQHVAGAANGAFGLGACLREGHEAGSAAAAACGFTPSGGEASQAEDHDFLPGRWLWLIPGEQPLGRKAKHFVDQQNDVTAADLKLALREGYRSIEHVKRYTTTGMATDQGKMGNVNAIGIVADELGGHLPDVGVTTFRPPYTPVTFGAFAGRDVDDLLDPVRRTPMHAWHERNGALFEDVGQWRRAWYYPQPGETMHAAVNREVKAVRESLGILDATTLGKIDIQGPDAAEFLNRIYTNAWLKLGVGRCRYGLMLKEDGMVMDDGVTTRLGEQHFLMTTTSGNAAAVMGHLDDYLQTEWPDLKVYITSVTEQFATMTLSGPNARKLLAELTDADLSPEALPHMAYTPGKVAGVPARIFRISFTGEVSYEINVPASFGVAVWQTLMTAGERYSITPYGTEAMHVLRAEKGYIIVGQETDGSVTPLDLDMDWIVSKTKDFVGKRSLSREDMGRPDRKQLVGLLTKDPQEVLPEGAQLVEADGPQRPLPMLGHVTSSYWSPNCGRSIAMAMVKGGLARKGETLFAPLTDGRTIACIVADSPVFFDPEGERLK